MNPIRFFHPPQPTRIWPTSDLLISLAADKKWDAEIKYNGWRLLIFKQPDNSLQFYNRHNSIISVDMSSFIPVLESIPPGTVFDAELLERRTKDLKGIVVIWDIPFFKGIDWRQKKLKERRLPLFDLFDVAPAKFESSPTGFAQIYHTQQFSNNFKSLYEKIDKRDDPIEEGLILKNVESIYKSHPSRAVDILDWLKCKKIGDHAKVKR